MRGACIRLNVEATTAFDVEIAAVVDVLSTAEAGNVADAFASVVAATVVSGIQSVAAAVAALALSPWMAATPSPPLA